MLILDAETRLGEGAVWHKEVLYWVDIDSGKVCIFDPTAGTNRQILVGQKVGAVVPRRAGGVAVALENGFGLLDLDTEELTILADPEADLAENRFNDGKCDPAGRFWAGTMGADHHGGSAGLYVLDVDHTVRKALDGVSVSNGIAWSIDSATMYYIDTPTLEVSAFDYDVDTGEISNRRAVITVPERQGAPDGMTIDSNGDLWIALWGGGCVSCWDPRTGELTRRLPVPAPNVTSCAFGGTRLDQLYVTTARGGLFRLNPGVRGLPAFEYRG